MLNLIIHICQCTVRRSVHRYNCFQYNALCIVGNFLRTTVGFRRSALMSCTQKFTTYITVIFAVTKPKAVPGPAPPGPPPPPRLKKNGTFFGKFSLYIRKYFDFSQHAVFKICILFTTLRDRAPAPPPPVLKFLDPRLQALSSNSKLKCQLCLVFRIHVISTFCCSKIISEFFLLSKAYKP